MLKVFYPPEIPAKNTNRSVFLAGSIDMDRAENWQARAIDLLSESAINVYNPRRLDWKQEWEQNISNPEFRQQVEWELDCLDRADRIVFYFDPNGKGPITLMELGLHAASGKCLVVCPEGYWRRGNVQILCDRYNIPMFNSLEEMLKKMLEKITEFI